MSEERTWVPYAITAFTVGLIALLAWVNRDRLNPVVPGRRAPDFVAFDLEGAPINLDYYRGKVLLVNIWATWCAPCRREMPSMERLYQEIDSDDFEILAVSVDAPVGERDQSGRMGGDVGAFADSLGLTFPILIDPSGEIEEKYQTTGVPESFVLDRDGVISTAVPGSTIWDSPRYIQLIRGLLSR